MGCPPQGNFGRAHGDPEVRLQFRMTVQGGEAVRLCAGQWDVNGSDLHNFWITSSKKEPLVLSFPLPLPTGEDVGMGVPASTV